MDEEELWNVVLYRYEAITRVEALLDCGETLASALEKVAAMLAAGPHRTSPPSAKTIEGWLYAFRHEGREALLPHARSDRGTFRCVPESVLPAVQKIVEQYRAKEARGKRRRRKRLTGEKLYELLVARGAITTELSLSTLYRFLRAHDITLSGDEDAERHRWEAPEPNHTWQADGLHGPYVRYRGYLRRTVIISILDDYSRFIIGSRAFFRENAANFLALFQLALCERGIPHKLYVDRGKAFNSVDVKDICIRLDIIHIAGTPYEPEGRGKQERWHRSLRLAWIAHLTPEERQSLSALNESLKAHVEKYNNRRHKTTGVSPRERWLKGNWAFRTVQAKGSMREIFGRRLRRRVDGTGCVSAGNALYEVSQALRRKWVTVVYLPSSPEEIDIEFEGKVIGTGKRLHATGGHA